MLPTILSNIISHNKVTEIGKKWNFQSIKTTEDYRNNVPLTDYEDYRPYIERMVEKGEDNLLTTDKVVYYCPTSGTTSKSKLIPQFVAPETVPLSLAFEQTLLLVSRHQDLSTPLDVPIIPRLNAAVGALITHDPSQFIAPPEAYKITDFTSAIYVQMVFGLKTSSVKTILAGFCPTVLTAFNLLSQEWEQMVGDIRNGTIKPSLNITEKQRITLTEAMGDGDPQRANELVAILSDSARCGDFKSLASQLWPSLSSVAAIAGGPFATYIPQLQHYLGDKICIGSPGYGASEGMFGVNKWLHSRVSAYSLLTSQVFFEFIPLANADSNEPKTTLLAKEIKVGEMYEIIVTTPGGLYRYHMGDIIKVLEEGNESEPPVIDVLGRKKLVLSICGEKVTDYQLTAAITAATRPDGPWNQVFIQGYMMTADVKSVPPAYRLWVELSPSVHMSSRDIQATLAKGVMYVDEKVAEINILYTDSKEQGSLMSTPVVTCCHLWHSVGCSNHQAYYISSSNRNTCIQVFLFESILISVLET